jgi:hypothetical protein
MRSSLRTWHRRSAAIIALFALPHIANHLVSLAGIDAHLRWMEAARVVYRHVLAETLLLACVAFQVGSGIWFVVRGWKTRRGLLPWMQALSGAYLAFFLLVHVGAVLYGRAVLGLDTNFYFAAAGFFVHPYVWFFAPYYFLAVLALFTHLGCAAYWQVPEAKARVRTTAVALPVVAGAVAALLIVLSLSGRIQPVEIPENYKATYLPDTP